MKHGFAHEGPRPKLTSIKKHVPRGNQKFQPLPQPSGKPPYHLSLDDVLSQNEMQKIKDDDSIVFHCTGDTGGVKDSCPSAISSKWYREYKSKLPLPLRRCSLLQWTVTRILPTIL